jgi:plasmid maintenance system antidote protein VapI
MSNETMTALNPNRLMDAVIDKLQLKNDAALSHALEVAPPVISKIRHNRLPVGASLMVRIHEIAGMSFPDMHQLLGTVGYKPYAAV